MLACHFGGEHEGLHTLGANPGNNVSVFQRTIPKYETPLQKTHNLDSSGESYSQNTMKYLVSIALCGLIMFISPVYGGRCSDKFITAYSGFLEYLHPGDEVMADRGFTMTNLLYERKVKLVIPTFTKRGMQLSEEDTTNTKAHCQCTCPC